MIALWPEHAPHPDAVGYLSVARYWAAGDWDHALNTYWSPLLSLLLAPAAATGLPLHDAARSMSVIVGAATSWLLLRLMAELGVSATVRTVICAASVPFVLHAALTTVSPDLLVAMLLLGFVTETVGASGSAVRAGAWAAFAFLAKSYALPFALVSLAAVALWRRARPASGASAARPVLALFVTLALSLPWIVAVSIEQGEPTISSAARYHRAVTAPGALGTPYGWAGPIEPTHRDAIFA